VELLDLLADAHRRAERYVATLDGRGVMPSAADLEALAGFREDLPDRSSDASEVLAMLDRLGSPATVASTGGRFFGFVVGGALPVTVAAAWLATVWDQNAGSWILAPAAAELEDVAAKWLLEILDLPAEAAVGFVTGSTMGTFSSIAAARSALLRKLGWNVKKRGLNGAPRLRIVVSEEIHPTNLATLGYAGFGQDDVETCPTDEQGRIIPELTPHLDDHTILMLQAGNINSGSFDPFEPLCRKAKEAGAWVHIDGAFGLWARALPGAQWLTAGAELANSWAIDGHKWLNLPQDSAVFICTDRDAVNDVFGVEATYLVKNSRRQPNTLTPELSRRARGVEFWAALKNLGRDGVADLLSRSCAHAQRFAEGLKAAGYEVLNDVVLNQVVFACGGESATKAALERIQQSGVMWLGPTHWKGRLAMRISVCSWATTAEDVERSLAVMSEAIQFVERPPTAQQELLGS
jgi:glutamate/tyrosine decarboxylase-like PLP-dependent enzyme